MLWNVSQQQQQMCRCHFWFLEVFESRLVLSRLLWSSQTSRANTKSFSRTHFDRKSWKTTRKHRLGLVMDGDVRYWRHQSWRDLFIHWLLSRMRKKATILRLCSLFSCFSSTKHQMCLLSFLRLRIYCRSLKLNRLWASHRHFVLRGNN